MTRKSGGYEQICNDLMKQLSTFDLAANAPYIGLAPNDDGSINLTFFGREYRAEAGKVCPLDGRETGVNHLSLIAHYLMSPGRGEPSYSFLPLGRMSGMVEGRGTYDRDAVNKPLASRFDGRLSDLSRAAERIGGKPEGRAPNGGLCWLFHPFPKVPVRLVHQEADLEFPADFRLLFDTTALNFMEFEALAFLAGVFVSEMCSALE